MRVYKLWRKDKEGNRVQYEKWYIDFTDQHGILRRVPGLTERRATEDMGRKIERLVAERMAGEKPDAELGRWLEVAPKKLRQKLAEFGVVESAHAILGIPLREHVTDWGKNLESQDASPRHILQAKNRVTRIFKACKFKQWSDIKSFKVQQWLTEQRQKAEKPFSASTHNNYLRSAKAFCNWMVRDGRTSSNPLNFLQTVNAKIDVKHERRALTPEEIGKLLEAAEQGDCFRGMPGRERALMYRLALETGLRASELRSLTKGSFDFKGNPPTVTVDAAHSKHRRTDVLPLRKETAIVFDLFLRNKMPYSPVFPVVPAKTCDMIHHDLDAAGIPYVDDTGRYADFHALRHTFITNLAKSGVHPKVAQDLARHSTISLTMDRYTHTCLETQVEALEKLPVIESKASAPTNAAV